MTEKITSSLIIAKLPLCLLVAFSALFGHIFAQQDANGSSLQIFFAVLLLACGGASYNSYQERFSDGLMNRTRSRPLVRQILSERHALIQATVLTTAGLTGIYLSGNTKAFIAGICGIALYNLAYTRLKATSIYALVPGALCGAIPPYIGWLAADGSPFSFQAVLLFSLLIFWQIPHFLLVMLNHRRDYLKSLAPNMLKSLREQALHRIFMPWITALSASMLIFTIMDVPLGYIGRLVIAINAIVLFVIFSYQLFVVSTTQYNVLFRLLNFCLFLFMVTICYEFY